MGLFLGIAATAVILAAVVHFGREELVGGKVDPAEHLARGIRRRRAFLFGDAEIIGGNQHLHIALDLHNGKNADGDVNHLAAAGGGKLAAVAPADAIGNAAAGLAAVAPVAQFRRQADGFRHLYCGTQNDKKARVLFQLFPIHPNFPCRKLNFIHQLFQIHIVPLRQGDKARRVLPL